MTPTILKKAKPVFGPRSNGILMTPAEFDRANFKRGWRYELINGVLIVSPTPSEGELDPNEELGRWLRNYREDHPEGKCLDKTTMERIIRLGNDRRRVVAGGNKQEAVSEDGFGNHRIAVAISHAPDFVARRRVDFPQQAADVRRKPEPAVASKRQAEIEAVELPATRHRNIERTHHRRAPGRGSAAAAGPAPAASPG